MRELRQQSQHKQHLCHIPLVSASYASRHWWLAVGLFVTFGCGAAGQAQTDDKQLANQKQVVAAPGAVRQVTLYRDRARVTRVVSIAPGPGRRRLDVTNLPDLVLPDSIYAEGQNGASVLAVRVSPQPRQAANREEVRELDKTIEQLNQQSTQLEHDLQVATTNLQLLDQLADFSVKTGKADLDHGVLDAQSLTELFTFSVEQREQLSSAQHDLRQQLAKLRREMDDANRRRTLVAAENKPLGYQATVFVELPENEAGTVKLNYLVGGCGWSPQYVIRGRTNTSKVVLRYSALVSQMSGEEWPNVQLVLSTATPSVNSSSPRLTPLRIESVEPANMQATRRNAPPNGDPFSNRSPQLLDDSKLTDTLSSLRSQQKTAEDMVAQGQGAANTKQRDILLNSLAGKLQQIELQAAAQSWNVLAPDARTNVASQVYRLPQPVSLDSRREKQLVQILESELEGEMQLVATPLLSTFAYREVQMTNTEAIGMLSGPASVYLDDRFVGRTELPPTASGQRLTVGMGADQQVRTRRELLDKEDKLQGGNRRVTFTYRLVIANFKDKPVNVKLYDRMPVARATKQLSATLEPPTLELSEDPLYLRVARPSGILRWDLHVDADRHGGKAFDVQYVYTLEFDRNRIPTTLDSLAELQAEYHNFQGETGGMGGMGGGGMGGGGQQ